MGVEIPVKASAKFIRETETPEKSNDASINITGVSAKRLLFNSIFNDVSGDLINVVLIYLLIFFQQKDSIDYSEFFYLQIAFLTTFIIYIKCMINSVNYQSAG